MEVTHFNEYNFYLHFNFFIFLPQRKIVEKVIKLHEKGVMKQAWRLHTDHKKFVKLNGLLRLEIAAENPDFEVIRIKMDLLRCCRNWAKDTGKKLKKAIRKYNSIVKFVLNLIGSNTKFRDRIPKIEQESKKILCKTIPRNFKNLLKKTKYLHSTFTKDVNS